MSEANNDNRYNERKVFIIEHEEVKHKNVIRGIGCESGGEIHDRVTNGLPLGLYKK
jgi:hypothetical protein